MLLGLRVRHVRALVRVQREAELALVGAQVILHEVRVLGEIHRLERELPQPLPPLDLLILARHGPARSRLRAEVPVHLGPAAR